MMQIRSLTLTKHPVWLDVPEERLDTMAFRSGTRFWPQGAKGVALFLFEFAQAVDADVLAAHGITRSGLGDYVYLQLTEGEDRVDQTIGFPVGTRLKRIGIRLWNADLPIVLEDIVITVTGGRVFSAYQSEAEPFARHDPRLAGVACGSGVLGLNLMSSRAACGARCHALCQHWYDTMDSVFRRYPKEGTGRVNGMFDGGSAGLLPVSVFHARPAMLRIPHDLGAYLSQIGDKSRNMIRKAQRLGYAYKQVDPDDYLDDILAIRLSAPMRQGKPIPDYFKVRPKTVYQEIFLNSCDWHRETFYGIFKDGELVAYATIYFYGELGQINHILGHKDHLGEGVMNLLVSEVVREIIEHRPWVKAINYLYYNVNKTDGGIGMFKKSIGFLPEKVVVTQSEFDIHGYLAGSPANATKVQAEAAAPKKSVKAGSSKLNSAPLNAFISSDGTVNRAHGFELALRMLAEAEPSLRRLNCLGATDEPKEGDFVPAVPHAVVFKQMPFRNLMEFLAVKLKGFRERIPKDSYLLFEFKRNPVPSIAAQKGGLRGLYGSLFNASERRTDQALAAYFGKRFKATNLAAENLKAGFKGSDYVVAGLLDYDSRGHRGGFDSLVILRKVR